jgi:hypothetical protein
MKRICLLLLCAALTVGAQSANDTINPKFQIQANTSGVLQKFDPCGGAVSCSPPKPEWVPDPSAGHYDCPDGWMAYSRSEPYPPYNGPVVSIYRAPTTDKKGHVLQDRPAVPICIQETK